MLSSTYPRIDPIWYFFFFFFNDTATTEIYTLSLHDALPIYLLEKPETLIQPVKDRPGHDRRYSLDSKKIHQLGWAPRHRDRKSTRLNSSHSQISYAVFCLKKKKKKQISKQIERNIYIVPHQV